MKDSSGSILEGEGFLPHGGSSGILGILERWLGEQSGELAKRLRDRLSRSTEELDLVLSVFQELRGQHDRRGACRFEWTLPLENANEARRLLEEAKEALQQQSVVIATADRCELAVRAGSTFLAEALGRGQDGTEALALERAAVAYRSLMEEAVRSVVIAPNYQVRRYRRLLSASRLEKAAVEFGVPTFALMDPETPIDLVGRRVLELAPELTDGDRDVRQLVRAMRLLGMELVATCLLWGLYELESCWDDMERSANVIVAIDVALNYAFYRSRHVLLPDAGTFQEGPFACYRRLNRIRYVPSEQSHAAGKVTPAALPRREREISLGEYVGHRFGKSWPQGQTTASIVAFDFWMTKLGQDQKEMALVALRGGFVRASVTVVPSMTQQSPLGPRASGPGTLAWPVIDAGPIRPLGDPGVAAAEQQAPLGYLIGQRVPFAIDWDPLAALNAFETNQQVGGAGKRYTWYDYAVIADVLERFESRGRVSWRDFTAHPVNGLVALREEGYISHRSKSASQNIVRMLRLPENAAIREKALGDRFSDKFAWVKKQFLWGDDLAPTLAEEDVPGLTAAEIEEEAVENGISIVGERPNLYSANQVAFSLLRGQPPVPEVVDPLLETARRQGWLPLPAVGARGVGFSVEHPSVELAGTLLEARTVAFELIDLGLRSLNSSIDLELPTETRCYALFSLEVVQRWQEGGSSVLGDALVHSQWASASDMLRQVDFIFAPLLIEGRPVLVLFCLSVGLTVALMGDYERRELRDELSYQCHRFLRDLYLVAVRVPPHMVLCTPVCPDASASCPGLTALFYFSNLSYKIAVSGDIEELIHAVSLDPDGWEYSIEGENAAEGIRGWLQESLVMGGATDMEL